MSVAQKIVDSLAKKTWHRRAIVTRKRQDKYDVIEIKPRAANTGEYADVSIVVDEDHNYLGIGVGRGNFFDITEPYEPDDEKLIGDIVDACVAGKLEETVIEKDNEILKSKVRIVLPDGVRNLYYRRSPLPLIGQKTHISYQPYPHGV